MLGFDPIAETYDRWYATVEGRAIFNAELACLRSLCEQSKGRWLEAGVGTGRFASMLGIAEGIDPSPRMLEIAAGRGLRTYEGCAEVLPFPDSSFDGVLLALTLCFVDDSGLTLRECYRVLRPEGMLLVGIIPSDSPWGQAYEKKKSEGHSVYSLATFLSSFEIVPLIESSGFSLLAAASTLLWEPDGTADIEPRVKTGIIPEAGFLGLLFKKQG
jgi:ubiquinone/menaquinone biosynthesis C-methylase UbiE